MKKTSYLMFELSCSEIVKRRRSGGGLNLKWIMLQSNSRVTNDIAAFELCSQDKLFAGDTRGYIGAIYKWDKANPFTRQDKNVHVGHKSQGTSKTLGIKKS